MIQNLTKSPAPAAFSAGLDMTGRERAEGDECGMDGTGRLGSASILN